MAVSKLNDKYVFNCHHCGLNGASFNKENSNKEYVQPIKPIKVNVSENNSFEYLKDRGISNKTIKHFGVFQADKYFQSIGSEKAAVGFPYMNNGEMYAVKYRCVSDKAITQEGVGGAQTFFNIDNIDKDAEEICIVEGEIDALSVYEAGYKNVLSVPNGAPQKVSNNTVDPSEDRKFQYLRMPMMSLSNTEERN